MGQQLGVGESASYSRVQQMHQILKVDGLRQVMEEREGRWQEGERREVGSQMGAGPCPVWSQGPRAGICFLSMLLSFPTSP